MRASQHCASSRHRLHKPFLIILGILFNTQWRVQDFSDGAANPWAWGEKLLLPPATKLGQGNIFRSVCPHSVHRGGVRGCSGGMHGCSGGCMVALGGHAWLLPGGHAWLLPGGVHGCSSGHAWLLQGGHAWLLPGGMHGCSWGVHGCSGVCMVVWGGMRGIRWDTEIRSMSGRYASYWNAFLFRKIFTENCMTIKEIGPREGAKDALPGSANNIDNCLYHSM